MSSNSSSPVPSAESAESFESPTKGGIFDAKLAKRLQLAENDKNPLISQSAKDLLSAEKDLREALMMIDGLSKAKKQPDAPKPESSAEIETPTEITAEAAEAELIQFPVLHPSKPTSDPKADNPENNVSEPVSFEPVIYRNEETELSQEQADSGLTVITAGEEADERVFRDFGFDEAPEDEWDEWDELYVRIKSVQSLQLLDRILKRTHSQNPQELTEKLRRNSDFHLPEKGAKKKK